MEEINEPTGQEQTIINIGNDPVMLTAVDVLSKLMIKNQIILKARGQSIPNAVAVANIITEKMLKGKSYDSVFFYYCQWWEVNCTSETKMMVLKTDCMPAT